MNRAVTIIWQYICGAVLFRDSPLQEKRKALQEYLLVTVNHISVLEKLLLQLSPEEALIIDRMLINPEKNVIFELMEQLHCESTQLYRMRARALRKLGHLRYGAAWKD